jgi:hypothetical protein
VSQGSLGHHLAHLVDSLAQSRKELRNPCAVARSAISRSRSTLVNVMSDSSSPVRGPGKRSSLRRLSTRACLSWQRTGRGTTFAAAHALLGDRPERLFRIYLAHFAPLVSPDRVAVEISHSKASLPTGAELQAHSVAMKTGTSAQGSARWCSTVR